MTYGTSRWGPGNLFRRADILGVHFPDAPLYAVHSLSSHGLVLGVWVVVPLYLGIGWADFRIFLLVRYQFQSYEL